MTGETGLFVCAALLIILLVLCGFARWLAENESINSTSEQEGDQK